MLVAPLRQPSTVTLPFQHISYYSHAGICSVFVTQFILMVFGERVALGGIQQQTQTIKSLRLAIQNILVLIASVLPAW